MSRLLRMLLAGGVAVVLAIAHAFVLTPPDMVSFIIAVPPSVLIAGLTALVTVGLMEWVPRRTLVAVALGGWVVLECVGWWLLHRADEVSAGTPAGLWGLAGLLVPCIGAGMAAGAVGVWPSAEPRD